MFGGRFSRPGTKLTAAVNAPAETPEIKVPRIENRVERKIICKLEEALACTIGVFCRLEHLEDIYKECNQSELLGTQFPTLMTLWNYLAQSEEFITYSKPSKLPPHAPPGTVATTDRFVGSRAVLHILHEIMDENEEQDAQGLVPDPSQLTEVVTLQGAEAVTITPPYTFPFKKTDFNRIVPFVLKAWQPVPRNTFYNLMKIVIKSFSMPPEQYEALLQRCKMIRIEPLADKELDRMLFYVIARGNNALPPARSLCKQWEATGTCPFSTTGCLEIHLREPARPGEVSPTPELSAKTGQSLDEEESALLTRYIARVIKKHLTDLPMLKAVAALLKQYESGDRSFIENVGSDPNFIIEDEPEDSATPKANFQDTLWGTTSVVPESKSVDKKSNAVDILASFGINSAPKVSESSPSFNNAPRKSALFNFTVPVHSKNATASISDTDSIPSLSNSSKSQPSAEPVSERVVLKSQQSQGVSITNLLNKIRKMTDQDQRNVPSKRPRDSTAAPLPDSKVARTEKTVSGNAATKNLALENLKAALAGKNSSK